MSLTEHTCVFFSLILKISDRAMSRSTEREAMRSPFDTETSGITELPQQIQETGSSQLYKTIKELMDQDPSNTISKEQCRQLLDRHCPSLTNDQVEPKNPSLPLIIFQCIIADRIQSPQQVSPLYAFKLKQHMLASVHGYKWEDESKTCYICQLCSFLVWYVFFNYSNQNLIYLCW